MAQKKRYLFRYLIIALAFCTVCVIYLGRLFYVQIAGRENNYQSGTTTQTVKIQASRGEIFDRNGVALVKNHYTYDLTLTYASVSALGTARSNQIYLRLLQALDDCGARDTHTEKYFPFQGTYPDYAFSPDAADPETPVGYRLQSILKQKGLEKDATVEDIVSTYTESYRLLEKQENGERLYSDYEVDRLLRLRYDMDAQSFGTRYAEYLFAKGADVSLRTYVEELGLSGIDFSVTADRIYTYPGYATHILGSVGAITADDWDYYNQQGYPMNASVGRSGCELAFESYLRGIDGEMKLTLDASGAVLRSEIITEPVSGKDVYLTIDINLQIAAEDGLRETVEYVQTNDSGAIEGFPCDSGAAVAMDPNTFDILAIASYPTYDLSTYNQNIQSLLSNPARPLVNRALQETYAPGSTFKVGIAAIGLNEGKISATSSLLCTGKYTRFDDYQPVCSTYPHGGSSYISVARALAVSCNCFFYELGYQLGIRTMDDYMACLGFGRSTGIELGEATGKLAGEPGTYTGEWMPGGTIAAAIGQSDTRATPLQICAYMATISNGGTRYAAHLLDRVCEYGSSEPLYSDQSLLSSPLSSLPLSSSTLDAVMDGMEQMTSSGTVRRFLNQCGVTATVGGKTGTAQVERYLTDPITGEKTKVMITNALFVSTATLNSSSPELVISVVIEKASSGTFASLAAARIIAAWELQNNEDRPKG